MISDPLYSDQIRRVGKLMRMIRLKGILLTTITVSLVLSSIFLGLQKRGLLLWYGYSAYVLLFVISFLIAWLTDPRAKKNLTHTFIGLDSALTLKERLSTAYEYHSDRKKTLFLPPLLREAGAILSGLKDAQVSFVRLCWFHWSIPLCVAALIALTSLDFTPDTPQQHATEQSRREMHQRIRAYLQTEFRTLMDSEQQSPHDISSQAGKSAQTMQDQVNEHEILLQSLRTMVQESSAQQEQIIRRLDSKLRSLTGENSQPFALPSGRDMGAEAFHRLEQQLNRHFQGEVPGAITQELSRLKKNLSFEQFLDAVTRSFESDTQDRRHFADRDKETETTVVEMREINDSSQNDSLAPKNQDDQQVETRRTLMEMHALEWMQPSDASKNGLQEGDGEYGNMFQAGTDKGNGIRKSPGELEPSEGQILKDKGISDSGERFSMPVRSLPHRDTTPRDEDAQEVVRAYHQAVEEILRKEDIPANYREYIKNYFLSIGLKNEDSPPPS